MNSVEIDLVQEKNKILFVPDNLEYSDNWKKQLRLVGFDWNIDVCTSLPSLKSSLRESKACVLVYHLNSFSIEEGQELLNNIQQYRVRD